MKKPKPRERSAADEWFHLNFKNIVREIQSGMSVRSIARKYNKKEKMIQKYIDRHACYFKAFQEKQAQPEQLDTRQLLRKVFQPYFERIVEYLNAIDDEQEKIRYAQAFQPYCHDSLFSPSSRQTITTLIHG